MDAVMVDKIERGFEVVFIILLLVDHGRQRLHQLFCVENFKYLVLEVSLVSNRLLSELFQSIVVNVIGVLQALERYSGSLFCLVPFLEEILGYFGQLHQAVEIIDSRLILLVLSLRV